jgi:hypothetical protein
VMHAQILFVKRPSLCVSLLFSLELLGTFFLRYCAVKWLAPKNMSYVITSTFISLNPVPLLCAHGPTQYEHISKRTATDSRLFFRSTYFWRCSRIPTSVHASNYYICAHI